MISMVLISQVNTVTALHKISEDIKLKNKHILLQHPTRLTRFTPAALDNITIQK